MKAKRLAELSVLTAVSLIIFIVELQIPNPFPIPGIKLGLANIITVFAVYHYKAYEVAMIVGVRLVLASGAVLCLLGMLLLKRIINEKHIWIASIFGAVLHNTGQIIAAVIVTQTVQIFAYYPFLLVSGCLAGLFTGLCAQLIMPRIKFFRK